MYAAACDAFMNVVLADVNLIYTVKISVYPRIFCGKFSIF